MTTTAATVHAASAAPAQVNMTDLYPIATEARDPNFKWPGRTHDRPIPPEPPRGGSYLKTCAATVMSCGLGGFTCNPGRARHDCHWRCCRLDCDALNCCFPLCTCCGCCCCWFYWAEWVHGILNVDITILDHDPPSRNLPAVDKSTSPCSRSSISI